MSSEGGTHVIRVLLDELPAFATDFYFVVSAYNCRNLSLFRSMHVRVFDGEGDGCLLSELTIADVSETSAAIVCSLSRKQAPAALWSLHGDCRSCDGTIRDYNPIEAAITPLQEHHCRWRRRRPFVLLAALYSRHRALPADVLRESDDVFLQLMRLPEYIFTSIVQFI
eukprot:TRINITY_DN38389_c0_g1_i2.p1 TRINITY_DN38389_c0_g1~~TRINITY_DN38389_c0_g1_i2.p1  ORF type:complete len:168 (+),score=28.58 TRINITY_DN38389_c0_g1_i2:228-731(+)